jgi:hypothetical protein
MIIFFLGLVFAQPQCALITEPLRMCVEAVGKLLCTSDLASTLDTSLVVQFESVSSLAVSVLGPKSQKCFELWRRARCKELFIGPGVCSALCNELAVSGCPQSLFPVAGCINQQTQSPCSDIFSGQCNLHAGEDIRPSPRPTPNRGDGGGGGGGGAVGGGGGNVASGSKKKRGGGKLVKLLLGLSMLRMF